MNYDICLFDLDGTLTDPKEGITKSVKNALDHFNIPVQNLDELTKFIGPPLRVSFPKFYGLSKDDTEIAVIKYRERFSTVGLFENNIYNGIKDMLATLKKHNKIIGLATSKPTVFAKKILEHFDIAEYFTIVVGSEFDGTRDNKCDVITYALEQLDPKREKKTVMIGDREHDIIGAKQTGTHSIGVTYGYGNRKELETAGAKKIVDTVKELQKLLLNS